MDRANTFSPRLGKAGKDSSKSTSLSESTFPSSTTTSSFTQPKTPSRPSFPFNFLDDTSSLVATTGAPGAK
ncbi:hypothetical protein V2J09_008955 [Rumex salicifolius]